MTLRHCYLSVLRILGFLFSFLSLSGCQRLSEEGLPKANRQDIQTLTSPPAEERECLPEQPRRPRRKRPLSHETRHTIHPSFYKTVSLHLTDTVPLKDVLADTAAKIGIHLQLDPAIHMKMHFQARDQPFIELLKNLCAIGHLRYTIVGQSVRIEPDTPYAKSYSIQFLSLSRVSENKVSIATDVFSGSTSHSVSANGSSSAVTGKGTSDFWTELEESLKTLLGAEATFCLHRQGGILTLKGTSKHHQAVQQYLVKLRQSVSAQVLIEAKVVEVTLKDDYKAGINWSKVSGGAMRVQMPLGDLAQRSRFIDPASAQGDMMSFGLLGKSFNGILKAIEEFGAARTLSNPRLTVMNNQTAVMKVAQNQVYFRLNYDKQYNLNINRENITISSDIQTVPIGLVMSVQPSIDTETGEVILALRPSVSRLNQSVSDPAVDIIARNTTQGAGGGDLKPSLIPVVEVREVDTVLRVGSDKIVVMGGFMEVRSSNGSAQVPGVGNVPGVGELFKSTSMEDTVVELVILLRATIAEDGPEPDAADRRLLEDYTDDARPFDMTS